MLMKIYIRSQGTSCGTCLWFVYNKASGISIVKATEKNYFDYETDKTVYNLSPREGYALRGRIPTSLQVKGNLMIYSGFLEITRIHYTCNFCFIRNDIIRLLKCALSCWKTFKCMLNFFSMLEL